MDVAHVQIIAASLSQSVSGDPAVRNPAIQHLTDLEKLPGFLTTLLQIALDANIDQQTKYLAVILCKNAVGRIWKPRGQVVVSEAERVQFKAALVSLLPSLFTPGSIPFTMDMILLVRKIARFDFPTAWPELMQALLSHAEGIASLDAGAVTRCILIHYIMKDQCSKRLLAARKQTMVIAPQFLAKMGQVWLEHFKLLQQQAASNSIISEQWQLSRFLDGTMTNICVHGYAQLHMDPSGHDLVNLLREKIVFMFSYFAAHPGAFEDETDWAYKDFKALTKHWALCLQNQPLAFVKADISELLMQWVGFLRSQAKVVPDAIAKNCLMFIARTLSVRSFQRLPPTPEPIQAEGHRQLGVFSERVPVSDLITLTMDLHLRLKPNEIVEWLRDPEQSVGGPCVGSEMRGAVETLFEVFRQPSKVGPSPFEQGARTAIIAMLDNAFATLPEIANNEQALVNMDALLTVVEMMHPILITHMQLDQFLQQFVPFLTSPQGPLNVESHLTIIAVRIASIIQAWGQGIKHGTVAGVFDILVQMLKAPSLALRIQAVTAVRAMLDHHLDSDALSARLVPFLDSCLGMLRDVKSPEAQWSCLNLIEVLISEEARSGRYEISRPVLDQLVVLWGSEDSEQLVRHGILDVLKAVLLMSCPSRNEKRVPLSDAILDVSLTIIEQVLRPQIGDPCSPNTSPSKCHTNGTNSGVSDNLSRESPDKPRNLSEDAMTLLLSILRVVDGSKDVHRVLPFLVPLLAYIERQDDRSLESVELDVLLEYLAVCVSPTLNAASVSQDPPVPLDAAARSLTDWCKRAFNVSEPGTSNSQKICFRVLVFLLADCSPEVIENCIAPIASSLVSLWITNASKDPPMFPAYVQVPLLLAFGLRFPQAFLDAVVKSGASAFLAVEKLLDARKFFRVSAFRFGLVYLALELLERIAAAGAVSPSASPSAGSVTGAHLLSVLEDLVANLGKQSILSEVLMAIQGNRSKVPKAVRFQRMISVCAVPESRHGDQHLVQWVSMKIIHVLPVMGQAFSFSPDEVVQQSSKSIQMLLRETASPASKNRMTSLSMSPSSGYVERG